jgi:hypothetical protein
MHSPMSRGHLRRSGRADQLSLQRAVHRRARVCRGQRVTHGVPVCDGSVLAGRGGGVQCVPSRYVRRDVWAYDSELQRSVRSGEVRVHQRSIGILLQRAVQCGLCVPGRVHQRHGDTVCRGSVRHSRRRIVHALSGGYLRQHPSFEHLRVQRALSGWIRLSRGVIQLPGESLHGRHLQR